MGSGTPSSSSHVMRHVVHVLRHHRSLKKAELASASPSPAPPKPPKMQKCIPCATAACSARAIGRRPGAYVPCRHAASSTSYLAGEGGEG